MKHLQIGRGLVGSRDQQVRQLAGFVHVDDYAESATKTSDLGCEVRRAEQIADRFLAGVEERNVVHPPAAVRQGC